MLRFIAERRDGKQHSREGLALFARAVANREVEDYQTSAWLMAAFLNPLADDETTWLTQAMADSGRKLDRHRLPKPWVDKHSTGGVGDKTTIVLLPVLAACGLTMLKMSGRGLGITGGTVDKLESIPGFRSTPRFSSLVSQALRCGVALSAQSSVLAPADKALYTLRDVTGTVGSIPLIVSSILSKKLAANAEIVVLDVKCGSGAFMKDPVQAERLSESLVKVGEQLGLVVKVRVSDMNAPLGRAVGNALEVKEAIDTLSGEEGALTEHCVSLASETLVACGLARDQNAGEAAARAVLQNGAAFMKAYGWFQAQGATEAFLASGLKALPTSSNVVCLEAPQAAGRVLGIDAGQIGLLVADMGGGRRRADDVIDPEVGVWIRRQVGESANGILIELHLRPGEPREAEFRDRALGAFQFSTR